MLGINLARSMRTPALTGHYLVDMSSHAGMITVPEVFVSNGKQHIPFASGGKIAPGNILGVTSTPLLRVPITALTDSRASVVYPVPPPSLPHEHLSVYAVYRGTLRMPENPHPPPLPRYHRP